MPFNTIDLMGWNHPVFKKKNMLSFFGRLEVPFLPLSLVCRGGLCMNRGARAGKRAPADSHRFSRADQAIQIFDFGYFGIALSFFVFFFNTWLEK
jgi:hypothetical protein